MAKYIIDVKDGETLYKAVIAPDGEPYITPAMGNVYTEPDLEQVRKEAYEEGKKQAKVQAELDVCHDIEKVSKENYKAGLSDAWEAARKIGSNSRCGLEKMGFKFEPQAVAYYPSWYVVQTHSASECIEKIRQYEQKKEEEIQVGDEIEAISGKAVVVYVDDVDEHKVRYVYSNGVYAFNYIDKVTKTGRHFPEIAEVLRKMKESNNG